MLRLILYLLCITLILGGCAVSPEHGLSLPFSERTDIIHSYEAINFVPVDRGEKNSILFFKSAPIETLRQYRSFDTGVISQSNIVYQSINNRRAAELMRPYIVQKLEQAGFSHTGKTRSQAGIAVTISSYQKILAKNIEELMVVVFDRNKARQLATDDPGLKGYRLLKQAAIWVGVVRQIPEQQTDISRQIHYMKEQDFQRMVDQVFAVFMQDSQYIPLN